MTVPNSRATRLKFVTKTLAGMVQSSHVQSRHAPSDQLGQTCASCRSIAEAASAEQPERRRMERVALHARVVGETSGGRFETDLLDLSSSGAFLESVLPFSEGTPLTLKLRVDSARITIPSEVCYSIEHVGVGVRFVDLREEDRKILDRFLDS